MVAVFKARIKKRKKNSPNTQKNKKELTRICFVGLKKFFMIFEMLFLVVIPSEEGIKRCGRFLDSFSGE
jgi:hypothetical protein